MTFCTWTNWTEVDAFYMSLSAQMDSVGLKWFLVSGCPVITSMRGRSVVLDTCTRPPIHFVFILWNSTANCNVPPQLLFYLVQAGVSQFVAKISFISTTHFYLLFQNFFFYFSRFLPSDFHITSFLSWFKLFAQCCQRYQPCNSSGYAKHLSRHYYQLQISLSSYLVRLRHWPA